ncbi:CDP-glycerol glycerophosphotransferase family protein [Apilactobacillus sp. TMW 2.2459]|uniref:bifunctional glycosyltransferase/CDP-glycerol:glycerophosphate glycerophosphotransferase n=1 Tax=Apilactobacillus xinyiensis TaxID=2841032 RepID=UPI00200FD0DA|nr:bifunctional glycosyltransferase/CDP-glycerol:glycerophosphate glycerophosphotransferase [Apilactobacillus xinyiensis]MCL0311634.1 CDP-glycerol glycerophosphotransferase family protein [Apilactobacillus xinyiensis]
MQRPDLSVVVACYNVDNFLKNCLDSIANTEFPKDNLEVLMIDDGSTDDTSKIVDEYANNYAFFKAFHKENGGISSTRNYGIDKANGKYLAFVDGDDIVPVDAYTKMVYKAEMNASDVTLGFVKRFDSSRYQNSFLHKFAVKDDLDHTHITNNHDLLYDTTVWNKVYRLDFLRENNIKFIPNIIYEDLPFTMLIQLLSKNTTVISDVVYNWRWRETHDSITQSRNAISNFNSRLNALNICWDILKKYDHLKNKDLINDFKIKILNLDLYIFLENVGDNEEDYIYKIQELVYKFLRDWKLLDLKLTNSLSIKHQIVYYAVKNGDLKLLKQFTYDKNVIEFKRKFRGKHYSLGIVNNDDVKLLDAINFSDNALNVAQRLNNFYYSKDETKISGSGFIKINHLPLVKRFGKDNNVNEILSAQLINVDNGKHMSISFKRIATSRYKRILRPKSAWKNAKYRFSFDIEKAVSNLGIGTWKIKAFNKVDNKFIASEFLSNPRGKASDKVLKPLDKFNVRISSKFNTNDELSFTVNPLNLIGSKKANWIKSPIVQNNWLQFKAGLVTPNAVRSVISNENGQLINGSIEKSDSNYLIKFNIDDLKNAFMNKKGQLLLLHTQTNHKIDYEFEVSSANEHFAIKNDNTLNVYQNNTSNILVSTTYRHASLESIKIIKHSYLRVITNLNLDLKEHKIELSGSKIEMISTDKSVRKVLNANDGQFKLDGNSLLFTVKLLNESQDNLNILRGNYVFKIYLNIDNDIQPIKVLNTKDVKLAKTKIALNSKQDIAYVNAKSNHFDDFTVRVTQPFVGLLSRTKARRAISYSVLYPLMRLLPLRKVMVFDAYWSSKFDSNEKLMYEYVQKNHPEIKTVWFFKNSQTEIDGNGKRVRTDSFKYWYYLAVAKYLIQNTNLPNQYLKRKNQIEVETLHGTFLKHMGFDEPYFKTASPRIQNAFARRNRRWDYMVVPSNYMADTASSAFDYHQKLIKAGFPRNDELYTNNNNQYINAIKDRLGIPKDKRVVLYAPTYRADEGFDFNLDLDNLEKQLSDDYVLLVRLHYFVAHSNSFYNNPGFVFDVSDYPNINDLYLISDLMVTDYSSVMFDYAHLKRPMLFYAYDKDWYLDDENRGVYLDYDKEIPGPVVETQADLINCIKNINEIAIEYKDKLNQFHDKFAEFGNNGDASKNVIETILSTKNSDLDQEPVKNVIFNKFWHFFKIKNFQATMLNYLSQKLSKKNIIMFESFFGTQYSDNPKAIYEYMKKNHPEFKMYWNVNKDYIDYFKQHNIPYIVRFGYKGIFKQARAKYWVTNVRRPFRWHPAKDTTVLQTWHGTPLKTIGADVNIVTMPGNNPAKYHKQVYNDDRRWDKLIAPNMYSNLIMQRAFRKNENQMMLTGYPRNDILSNYTENDVIRIKARLGIKSDKKVILYAPTWRDDEFVKDSEFTAKLHLDLNKIKAHYGNDVLVLIRTHYLISNSLDLSEFSDVALDVSLYDDIAELYLVSDVLITDYSSVMFDYSILKRPIIFFAYDLEKYAGDIRGFYFDFVNSAPGKIVKTSDEVIQELDNVFANNWTPNDNYIEFYNKYNKWMDGSSTKRVVDELLNDNSVKMHLDDDLSKYNLKSSMTLKDGAAIWNIDKDFTNNDSYGFIENYNYTENDRFEVKKVMLLKSNSFDENVGKMKYAVIKYNGQSAYVNLENLE